MDMTLFNNNPDEKPLDRILNDGGFCGIFRTIGVIGDSLSSGEFESTQPDGTLGYHECYEYSWGKYIARAAGLEAYIFSRGGMTASEYMNSFAEANGFWEKSKLCQAYIIALGVNDIINFKQPVGSIDDIDLNDYTKNNMNTFAGCYGALIQKLRTIQPRSRIFLVTMVHDENSNQNSYIEEHAALLYKFSEIFGYTYVIDLARYAPVYDSEFKRRYYMGSHMTPMGYLFTGRMISSYIDYIIRNNPNDFSDVGFIGTDLYNSGVPAPKAVK